MAVESAPDIRISVRNLWKLFGNNDKALLQEDWVKTASKAEIQEKTGHVIAMREVSFEVAVGKVFVVMGLSGSGKSTLVRALNRLVEPSDGIIEIDGEDILQYDNEQIIAFRRKKIGMVFQHYGLLPHKNVIDNVAYGLEVQGMEQLERHEIASGILDKVGLSSWEYSYPYQLSGGMQQRVGIARALALDPEIMLMDEPFSGLDPLIRREMQDELITLQAQVQKTIVFITHDLDEALKLGDHIAIMRDGAIIQQGTAEEIVTKPVDGYVKEFVRDISKTKVLKVGSIMKKPKATIQESQSPAEALQIMKSEGLDYTFVVAETGELLGALNLAKVESAVEKGFETSNRAINKSCPRVLKYTLIDDVIPLVAKQNTPVAVVNDHGILLGEIEQSSVLSSIASS
jgi:glycine betaine/proline transport system ATP-binding protein